MEEYEFVKELPEDYFCMICAKILNEPHLTDCCGQHFCGVCLERWFEKQAKKICPRCRLKRFSYMRDLPLKRKINALQIYCPFREQGCEEITTVGEVNAHKDGCGFAQVVCNQGCGVSILRKDLRHHCEQQCPKRKVKCPHCGEEGHFEVINGDNVTTCEEYPMECPKACGHSGPIKRKNLTEHAVVCPLELVPCTFSEVGCDEKVLYKDLKDHIDSNVYEHMMKMMSSHTKLMSSHTKLKEECRRLSSHVKSLTLTKPIMLNNSDNSFTFTLMSSEGWLSPPFYIKRGYKFCIEHIENNKVRLLQLRGEVDASLEWPMDLRYELEIRFEKKEENDPPTLIFSHSNIRHGGRVSGVDSYYEMKQLDLPLVIGRDYEDYRVTVTLHEDTSITFMDTVKFVGKVFKAVHDGMQEDRQSRTSHNTF